MVAIASLHERFEDNDNSISSSDYDIAHDGFALQQYNRAISYLIQPVAAGGNLAIDVSLVAGILFACFEVFYSVCESYTGHDNTKRQHVSQICS